jgi:hypothetical protein
MLVAVDFVAASLNIYTATICPGARLVAGGFRRCVPNPFVISPHASVAVAYDRPRRTVIGYRDMSTSSRASKERLQSPRTDVRPRIDRSGGGWGGPKRCVHADDTERVEAFLARTLRVRSCKRSSRMRLCRYKGIISAWSLTGLSFRKGSGRIYKTGVRPALYRRYTRADKSETAQTKAWRAHCCN